MGWLPEAEKISMHEEEDPKEAECQAPSSSQFGQLLAAISHFVDLFFQSLVRSLEVTSKLQHHSNYFRRDLTCQSSRTLPLPFRSLLSILPKLSLKPLLAPSYPWLPRELSFSPPPFPSSTDTSVRIAYSRLPRSSVYLLSTLNWSEEPALRKWPTVPCTEEPDVQCGGFEGRKGWWQIELRECLVVPSISSLLTGSWAK